MTAADLVCTRLLSIAGLDALVSTRIYAMRLPENPILPAIRVALIDEVDRAHLRGLTGVPRARVQTDVYAAEDDGVDALSIAREIRVVVDGDFVDGEPTGLSGFTGDLGSPPVTVSSMLPGALIETYLPGDLRQAVSSRDYFVKYRS